ncbi:MAG: aspartate/glutamate racemase family protein [Saezia sp.]
MKTIGLIGGMSWESTVTYYQMINRVVKRELGGLHSAKCVLQSVDFDEIEHLQVTGRWEKCGELLGDVAASLERGGADCIVLCTNTMHKVSGAIEARISIPFLHIARMTLDVLKAQGVKQVALLGTRYTMQEDFYKKILIDGGVQVLIPDNVQCQEVNRVIFEELCLGEISAESKAYFLSVMDDLMAKGAQGVILGCTEIGLLVSQADTQHPLFDTTQIHAEQAGLFAVA